MFIQIKSLVSSISIYQLKFEDNFPEDSGIFSSLNETMFENSGVDQCFSVLEIQIIKYYFPAISWRDRIKQRVIPRSFLELRQLPGFPCLPNHFTARSAHSLSSYVFTLHAEVSQPEGEKVKDTVLDYKIMPQGVVMVKLLLSVITANFLSVIFNIFRKQRNKQAK